MSVNIAEIDADKPTTKANASDAKPKATVTQYFGLSLSDLTDAQKQALKLKSGVRVDAAVEAAARAGLREGDVILSINNAQTTSVKDLEVLLSKHDKSKPVNVLFRRGEWTQYAVIKVNP